MLRPKARKAARQLMPVLDGDSLAVSSVGVSLGLAEPEALVCNVFLRDDSELERYRDGQFWSCLEAVF